MKPLQLFFVFICCLFVYPPYNGESSNKLPVIPHRLKGGAVAHRDTNMDKLLKKCEDINTYILKKNDILINQQIQIKKITNQ